MMSKLPNVSKEFLKDSAKQNSKRNGGRYSREQRTHRRQEVYRLHFEHHWH